MRQLFEDDLMSFKLKKFGKGQPVNVFKSLRKFDHVDVASGLKGKVQRSI